MARDLFKVKESPTPRGVAALSLFYINRRIKNNKKYTVRGIDLTIEQLENFYIKNWDKYTELYKKWKREGFARKYCPTVDRIDNDIGYSVGNIQILPFGENVKKDMSRLITEWHRGRSDEQRKERAEHMSRIASKGGESSAKNMTPKQRKERAIKASHARFIKI